MKTKLFFSCFIMLLAFKKGYSQKVNRGMLELPIANSMEIVSVDMYDKSCIHVVDGLISSFRDTITQEQLAHFERAVSAEKLSELGFSSDQCVIIKSTADLDIENYIFRQVDDQVRQIGINYKVPIAVNGKLLPSYPDRRSKLSKIKPEQIKRIKFLDKVKAKAKYGDKVIFGLVEIEV
jgi:hypothetical protein